MVFTFGFRIQGGCSHLIAHAHPPEGMLTVSGTIPLYMVPVGFPENASDLGSTLDPGLVYDNYCKDYKSQQYYGCSYVEHMHSIIDNLISCAENSIPEAYGMVPGADISPSCDKQCHVRVDPDGVTPDYDNTEYDYTLDQQPNVGHNCESSFTDRDKIRLIRDFNYPNKSTAYLAQESTNFEFIGPDRQPVAITSFDQLTSIANTIRGTGLPNYRAARIPLVSALNVKA